MAVSILVKRMAKLKRAILNKAIKSPTERLLVRLTEIAKTSVPSMTAPPRMESPIPAPKKKPPKMEMSNLSAVMPGMDIK